MPLFPDPTKNSILVATFNNVTISRVAARGKQTCYPGYVKFYTALDKENKGWIISRNDAENVLLFNALVPGGVPIKIILATLTLHVGKVPSLSYCDKRGKPIPTFWDFQFTKFDEMKRFYGLLVTFSRLADAVNTIKEITAPLKTIEKRYADRIPEVLDFSDDDSDDESDNLLNESDDDLHNKENAEPESPLFAQSQDIYESLGLKKEPKKYNTPSRNFNHFIDCLSPLED